MFLLSVVFAGLCVIGWIGAHVLALKAMWRNRLDQATVAGCAAVLLLAGNIFIGVPAFLPSEYYDYKVGILAICLYAFYMHTLVAKPVVQSLTEQNPPP